MLIEQSLINPNFIGRDSFRWFVGIVTKYTNTENGYRAKVRIIGHHPDSSNIVKDEELPWAHVLVPLNMGAGEGGAGVSFNLRGSETVIGFFMDGDDGQQPVIIGSLFSGSSIDHPNTFDLGTNGFKPFKPGNTIINPSNIPADGTAPKDSGIPRSTGQTPDGKESQKQASVKEGTAPVVITVPSCKEGTDTVSKIAKALRKFIYYLNTAQNYINIYVNPTLNFIENIPGLIQDTASAITDGLSEFTKLARDFLIEQIYQGLKNIIEKFLPKDAILAKKLATDKVVDGIWCTFQNILKKIAKFVFDFVGQMVGKVVAIPLCAIESFIGSMMQTIANEITEAIGPAIKEITSILGQGIGQITGIISKAINYAKTVLSFFACEDEKCKEEFDYEMNKGYVPKGSVNFQKILNYSPAQGVRNLFTDAKGQFSSWLGQNSGGDPSQDVLDSLGLSKEEFAAYASCDGTTLNCGLPKVTFFGGVGGSGGSGTVIVDALSQILGVNVTDPGSSYSSSPYVYFEDACNTGGGARGNVILKDGKVDSVYMISNGYDYIGPEGDPCTTNPIGDDGLEYTAYISDVIIVKTGVGYKETDLIYNIYCDTGVEIYPVVDPDGRIISTKIVNGGIIRTVPELAINTTTGSGAILIPVLKFLPIGEVQEDRKPKQKVILCADKQ
jgi:hypothetical protein